MPGPESEKPVVTEEYAEVFQLRFPSSGIAAFLEEGNNVNKYFSAMKGYRGMEILLISDTELIVLIRWESFYLFDQHLPVILNACSVVHWLRQAQAIAHRPAILKTLEGSTEGN